MALVLAAGCGAAAVRTAPLPLGELRQVVRENASAEAVGRWALGELLEPGGTSAGAAEARARLDRSARGDLHGELARAIFDHTHGKPRQAAAAYVAVLQAARTSRLDEAKLFAWFATRQLVALRGSVANLYQAHRAVLEPLLARPGFLGWRAVADLAEWHAGEVLDRAETTGDAYDRLVVAQSGCSPKLRLAGPFGRGVPADRRRAFAAEQPGPWPVSWAPDPVRGSTPRVLRSEQHRCLAACIEQVDEGVFYAETFFTTDRERELIVAAQGGVKLWVDDTPVLDRDLRRWGVWQRFGAHVAVGAGRHRVLARVMGDASSIRLLNIDGTPAGLVTDADAQRSYSLVPARVLDDPNPIDPIVRAGKGETPAITAIAAFLAHVEGMDDVASSLLGPLVEPANAAPVALELAGGFSRGDAAVPEQVRRRSEQKLRTRAVAADPKLWASRLWLLLDEADRRGEADTVGPFRELAAEFPEVPDILEGLARSFGRLGWTAERTETLADMAARFPDDVDALRLYLDALQEHGSQLDADAVAARVRRLDPDAEVDLDRALGRKDWASALAELERLKKRRPDRKEVAARIATVLARSGDPTRAAALLEETLAKNPDDSRARFRIADAAYARGDRGALRRALAEALQFGGKTQEIREAVDLLEGATNLEVYRVDGRAVIAEFEAWEKRGNHMDGTAARVLDYSALWVHPNGSSEMLEHEIVRIQSQEALREEAEQAPPQGLVLRVRVIKPSGKIFEPERVAGKATLTLPHLEVGDYVETEHVTTQHSDGRGRRYEGPHWFFREADKGYWRSEFVVISPKDKKLDIELRGNVPPPKLRELGPTFVERTFRVDESPPAIVEPDSPRPTEFLPSVRVGWGVTLSDTIARLADLFVDETPLDPRLGKRAEEIAAGIPKERKDDRARAAYRWVLENVEEGKERDGRRVIFGKSGSRQAAFEHLVRQLGIPFEGAIVENKLAAPPIGPMSDVERWSHVLFRLETERGPRWLAVGDKFAPYGYVPAELRGQPAIRLVAGAPREILPTKGSVDGITFEGRANVRSDGSATVELVQRFSGSVGISVRNVLERIPQAQLHDFVETRIVARNIPGARVRDVKVENAKAFDEPLTLRVRAEVSQLLRAEPRGLVLRALFPFQLGQLASLPERQTPLLLGGSSHVDVRFQLVFPGDLRMPASLPQGTARDDERVVTVNDTVSGHAIFLDRSVDIPAGRIVPGPSYGKFLRFTQEADALVDREIAIGR